MYYATALTLAPAQSPGAGGEQEAEGGDGREYEAPIPDQAVFRQVIAMLRNDRRCAETKNAQPRLRFRLRLLPKYVLAKRRHELVADCDIRFTEL